MNDHATSRRQVLRAAAALGGAAAATPALGGLARAVTGSGTAAGNAARTRSGIPPDTIPPDTVSPDMRANRIVAAVRAPRIPRRRFPVTRYGAVADGVTDNTAAIAAAIAAA